jgi:hypothetical protein
MKMLEKTKENATKPKITPIQLILFAVLTGWLLITNLQQFQDLAVGWQIIAQIGFYVAIMFTAGQKGNISSLIRSLIGIIVNGDDNDIKMLKLQNLVVAICQELGLLYEQEKEKFFEFIEGNVDLEREAIEAELAKLEEDNEET